METVCPKCATRIRADGVCPKCDGGIPASEPVSLDVADAELAALAAELCDAFGSGAYDALDADGVTRAASESRPGSARPAPAEEPGLLGTLVGDFELLAELGRGGMGVVYRAHQVSLDREVALKILPSFARRNRAAVARFRRESQAAAKLHHTNIVPIYAQGDDHGKFYYAMELIEGESLYSAMRCDSSVVSLTPRPVTPPTGLRTGPGETPSGDNETDSPHLDVASISRTRPDYQRLASLLADVADGLAHAHECGVIHRDVKPQNLLLGLDRRLHITDFGLAHLLDEPHLTISGELMGTPAYMSPEQVEGNPSRVDHRTDVYSLGVTLYELLVLRRPFEGSTRAQIINRISSAEAAPPRRIDPRIPRDLETICLRTLEKDPARRYQSAAALAEDLRRFAAGRPILTRRTGLLERGAKWARRHKGAAAAIISGSLVLILGTALGASLISARRAEAGRLIDEAYAQLAYHDFRQADRVLAAVDRADELGGDRRRIEITRAIMAMDRGEPGEAIQHLNTMTDDDPEDVEALYLLAWAHWADKPRAGHLAASLACFDRAEKLGGAQTAAEWFFRGLASQRANPSRAVESYRRARQVCSAEGEFYPLATLHLARAQNQIMYRTRRINAFDSVEEALLQLIEYDVYDSKPYYLLSIANRLAAEIYSGSGDSRPEAAEEHYKQALYWADEGIKRAKPGNDAPLTAKAECLESMGDFLGAIEARTAAIQTAALPKHQWEGYHYRWRLHYWTGHTDEALADLAELAERFDPQSIFYSHVYPMLVHAGAGQMDEAFRLAREVADMPADSSAPWAQHVLWSATCLRLLGQAEEARRTLADSLASVDFDGGLSSPQTAEWMSTLYDYATDGASFGAVLDQANKTSDPPKLLGEAHFHAAALKLADADRAGAAEELEQAYRAFDDERRFTYHARILWDRMAHKPRWSLPLGSENAD